MFSLIIALKASGRDCTNNNELLHKIGVLQCYAMQFVVFTRDLSQYRFDGAVSIMVVHKESNNKVEGSSPSNTFFFFFFFFFLLLQICKKCFVIYMFAEKKQYILMCYAHVKRLHSVKWRSLYEDTATMQ